MPASALQNIPNVEIARVGTWNTSTGTWVCTPADIQDAVRAAADPTFRTPVIKLGHTDPRFNGDGEPAFGRVENIRASEDGQVLIGDLVAIPAWLAEAIPTAYPSRSIEASMDVVTPEGARYGMVVSGLALLGVALPAIQSLADLRERLGAATDEEVTASLPEGVQAGSSVYASVPAGDGAATVVRASATIDELILAVKGWVTSKGLSAYTWVREVYTDRIILDDDDGKLWAVTWAESAGSFTFGDPQKVRVEYVPVGDTVAAAAAHRLDLPLLYVRGQVAAAGSEVDEHQERTAVADLTERQQALREKLGLGEDATAEQIEQAMLDRLQAPPTEQQQNPQAGQQPATTTPDTPAEQPAEQGQLVNASSTDPRLEQITALSREVAELRKARYEEGRDRVIMAALSDGKIAPSQRETWAARYDKDAALTTEILASLTPGTAIPVAAKGRTGDDQVPDEDAALWGEVSRALGFAQQGGGA